MTSDAQYEIVVDLIEDAVASGATKLCGGPTEVAGLPGKFVAPTVLTGVTHEMRIMREEVFGPVLPIVVVDDEQEAIELANDSEFGLGASVWTKDRQKGERIARRIESGMVWVNDHSFSHGACQCAWGGVKDSGVGRSHSKFGFYECVNIKMNAWEPGLTRDFWWHPYDGTLGEAVRASAKLLYGKGATRTKALREGAGPLLKVGRPHPAQAPLTAAMPRRASPVSRRRSDRLRGRAAALVDRAGGALAERLHFGEELVGERALEVGGLRARLPICLSRRLGAAEHAVSLLLQDHGAARRRSRSSAT